MSIGTSQCLAKTEGLCWGQQTKCTDDGTDRRNGDNKLCRLNYIKLFLCQFSWCTLKLGSMPGHCNWAKINTYLLVPGPKSTPTYRFLGQNQHLLTGSWVKIKLRQTWACPPVKVNTETDLNTSLGRNQHWDRLEQFPGLNQHWDSFEQALGTINADLNRSPGQNQHRLEPKINLRQT